MAVTTAGQRPRFSERVKAGINRRLMRKINGWYYRDAGGENRPAFYNIHETYPILRPLDENYPVIRKLPSDS